MRIFDAHCHIEKTLQGYNLQTQHRNIIFNDVDLYKLRHLVENAFLDMKRWRGLATRYAKLTSSFIAAVQIRCMMIWLKIS